MKRNFLVLTAALALAGALTSSLSGQPLPPVLMSDSADANFVITDAGHYAITEYFCTNHTSAPLTINGLTFTNNPSGLGPGTVDGTLSSIFRGQANSFTGPDQASLYEISGGDMYCPQGINITNIPTQAGHSYVLEMLFHDNYYNSTNQVGKRQFNVEFATQANTWPSTVILDHMDLAGMGAGYYNSADVLVRAITNDCDGSALIVILRSLAIDSPMISAFALVDLGPSDVPLVFKQPVSQTTYVGAHVTFPCYVVGSGISSQKWQSDAGSPGTYYDLADGTLPDGCVIAGATATTLSLDHVTTAEAGNYQLVVTNPNGTTTAGPAALTVVPGLNVITGPADPNLLLSGNFYYAEYYGADYGPLAIGGLTFRNNNARLGGNAHNNYTINFGATQDATNLALISAGDVWAPGGNSFDFTLPTINGRSYTLQLLFHDNAFTNVGIRKFSVNVGPQGSMTNWVTDLDLAYLGAWTTNPVDVVLTLANYPGDGNNLEVQLAQGSADNPLLSAMTWQDVSGAPVPPMIVSQPVGTNIFAGRTATLSVGAVGTPLNYQWQSSPANWGTFTDLADGANLWGSTTPTLTITNIAVGQSLDYRVVVSNGAGTATSSTANINVLPPTTIIPGANYAYAISTNNAVDYWRLNETSGSPMVYDVGPGGKDGIVGANLALGASGPQSPDFPAFEADNACMQSASGTANDFVTAPPLNLNTNTVTLLAWLYPTANQSAGAGLMLDRQGGSGPATGLAYGIQVYPNGDYSLRYFWNGVSTDSGAQVPQNIWSLVALVVTPTSGSIYVLNANGMTTWSAAAANAVLAFSDPFLIGNDPADGGNGARTFTGDLDEVSVFNKALTTSQILTVFTNTTGIAVIPPNVGNPTLAPFSGSTAISIVNPGTSVTLSCSYGGVPTPSLQWKKRVLDSGIYVDVPGATSGTLTFSSVTAANTGDYVLYASNKVGTATSATPARLLVAQANAPALIGRWLTGDQSLADESGFNATGVHDGIMTAGSAAWDTGAGNVPPGFDTGLSSLNLGTSGGKVKIANSAAGDSDYRIDYDNNITNRFTVAVWAKGWPSGGSWYPFMSKNCEAVGWAVRRGNNGGNNPIFSVVGPLSGANGTYSGVDIRDSGWHHYAGTWDGSTGIRRLYVDGNEVACAYKDYGSVTPANTFHLVLGAEENPAGTITRPYTGNLFDARMYNYALAQAEVQSLLTSATANAVGLYLDAPYPIPVGQSEAFTVMIPVGANAAGPITVTIVNNSPSVATIRGATGNTITHTFAKGDPNTYSFILDTIGAGTISLSATADGGLSPGTLVGANVVLPGMTGHWLTGAQSMADSVNIDGAGAHDGQAVGTGAAAWDGTDRPTGFSGSSLNFATANYGMAIKGSSTITTGDTYYPTFDVNTVDGFSCSFWAKGIPGTYNPWVSKFGDGNGQPGWEVRQNNNLGQPSFRMTQVGSSMDAADTFNSIHSFNTTDLGSGWHHYLASYDGGVRRIYIDGVLSICIPNDVGPMPPQPYAYLVFGALDGASANANPPAHAYSKYFNGKMFDARMYNYPLNGAEALAVMNANDSISLRAVADYKSIDVGHSATISFSLPEGVTAATVTVDNLNPSIATIVGAPSTLTFSSSTPRAKVLTLNGVAEGTATIQFSAPGLTATSVTVKVYGQHLIGHWLVGLQDLQDHSGFTPAHTHDGVAYNSGTVKTPVYGAAPSGFPGSSLSIPSGGSNPYGVLISNTAATFGNPQTLDVSYQPTFDDLLANRFTIAFWENATTASGNWSGLVGKLGEGDAGYLVHRNNATTAGDFVIKSTASHSSDVLGSANLYNSTWHHIAAVWDGYTGVRQLYVDGLLDASWSGDYGPMAMAPNHHLTFASEEGDSVGAAYLLARNGYLAGNLYDVRIYNYALSQADINNLRTAPVAPTVSLTSPANNARYLASVGIPLSASVTANGNTINSVTYYQGATLIGTGSGPTWSATSSGLAGGAYDVYAVVSYSPDGFNMLTLNSAANHVTIYVVAPIINTSSYDPATGHLTISGQNTGGVSQNSRLVYTDNLSATPVVWHQFTPDVTSTGTTFSFTITNVTTPAQRFYKVQNY
jgi:Concanavalin A-like lectin/glucanases superfamily/Bacterial Ig domain/Immunoglobulin domain